MRPWRGVRQWLQRRTEHVDGTVLRDGDCSGGRGVSEKFSLALVIASFSRIRPRLSCGSGRTHL